MLNKAIALNQPWASLVVNRKRIIHNVCGELKYRGRLYVYATNVFDLALSKIYLDFKKIDKSVVDASRKIKNSVVGVVDLTECAPLYKYVTPGGSYQIKFENAEKFQPYSVGNPFDYFSFDLRNKSDQIKQRDFELYEQKELF